MRLFFSLPVPEEIRNTLARTQGELSELGESLRFVDPELMHITVAFLGEFDPVVAADVGRRVAIYSTPIQLSVFGIGAFAGPKKEVAVVFAAVRGSVPLEVSIHHELGLPIRSSHGLPTGHFGHITLARGSESTNLEMVSPYLGPKSFGSWTADHFELVESRLGRGTDYRLVQRFDLIG